MIKGAYLHIPFCEHICYYCDFNKVFLKNQPVNDYLDALEKEMTHTLSGKKAEGLETIFVGGGTPTALNNEQMILFTESVAKHLYTPLINEFTMEANPGNLDKSKLNIMKRAGVDRLSIGVQAFQDDLLQAIGRTHRQEDVFKTIQDAREVGFDNISVDLMFGLPNQTMDMLKESVEKVIKLDIEHVSIYSLQIEPKTIFYNRMKKGTLNRPSEDTEAAMYELIIEELQRHGFSQYEISNFSKPGYQSKHNLLYWQNEEYYGFGAGAHGYVNQKRVSNMGPIKKYINLIETQGHAVTSVTELTTKEQMEEQMFLGLRMLKGVSKTAFRKKFNCSIDEIYGTVINDLIEKELIEINGDYIHLSHKGLFLGNNVFEAFLL